MRAGMSSGPSDPVFWDLDRLRREIALAAIHHPRTAAGAPSDAQLRAAIDACDLRAHCGESPSGGEGGQSRSRELTRLVLRARAVWGRHRGIAASEKLLGNSDLLCAIGCVTAPLSNLLLGSAIGRLASEKLLGVDRRHRPSAFATTPFDRWFRKRERKLRKRVSGAGGTVALHATCRVNYRHPAIARSALAVLMHNDVRVLYPEQRCCGRSLAECGDLESAILDISFNAQSFRRHLSEGATLVVLGELCGEFIREEAPWLVEGDEVRGLATAAVGIFEFLDSLRAQGNLRGDFRPLAERVALVGPTGPPGGREAATRSILGLIPRLEIVTISGAPRFGWSRASRKEFFAAMGEAGRPVAEEISRSGVERIACECTRTACRLQTLTGVRAVHPIELMREAYGIPEAGRR